MDLLEYHLTRLQKIHNRAARLVVLTVLTPVSSHITPVLEQLHWLPVRQRIVSKYLYSFIKRSMILCHYHICYIHEHATPVFVFDSFMTNFS